MKWNLGGSEDKLLADYEQFEDYIDTLFEMDVAEASVTRTEKPYTINKQIVLCDLGCREKKIEYVSLYEQMMTMSIEKEIAVDQDIDKIASLRICESCAKVIDDLEQDYYDGYILTTGQASHYEIRDLLVTLIRLQTHMIFFV